MTPALPERTPTPPPPPMRQAPPQQQRNVVFNSDDEEEGQHQQQENPTIRNQPFGNQNNISNSVNAAFSSSGLSI